MHATRRLQLAGSVHGDDDAAAARVLHHLLGSCNEGVGPQVLAQQTNSWSCFQLCPLQKMCSVTSSRGCHIPSTECRVRGERASAAKFGTRVRLGRDIFSCWCVSSYFCTCGRSYYSGFPRPTVGELRSARERRRRRGCRKCFTMRNMRNLRSYA